MSFITGFKITRPTIELHINFLSSIKLMLTPSLVSQSHSVIMYSRHASTSFLVK
ncbi:MAG: hypothetical protein ACTS79_01295 [Arsenophonus sp. ET-KM2-MAG3]